MSKTARTLELSIGAHGPASSEEIAEKRRQQIRNIPEGFRRFAVSGIDALTEKHTGMAETALRGLVRKQKGLEYLGSGAFASVYRQGGEVLKVYRDSTDMSEEERAEFIWRKNADIERLRQCTGDTAVALTLGQETHPLGEYPTAVGRQAYIPGQQLSFFTPNSLELNRMSFDWYLRNHPQGEAEVADLIAGTMRAHEATGLVPDLNGANNFVISNWEGTLKLVDVDPIPDVPAHTDTYHLILEQAEVLDSYLD